ncbi:MAG: hypothetical protein ACE5FY_05065 [Nitrospiria bacterium]
MNQRTSLFFSFQNCIPVVFLFSLFFPSELLAIHAIIKDADPVPRKHGPVFLGMSVDKFLQSVKGEEVPPAIGQFQEEGRYSLNLNPFPSDIASVIVDFYKERLFRIEINYQPQTLKSFALDGAIDTWSEQYGSPRINILPDVKLVFWDDGLTRMILQVNEVDNVKDYSITYIDDDLFHRASRERVQLETGGQSSYGK